MNNTLIIIGLLFLLDGASYHSKPYYIEEGAWKPFNQEHNLIGIGYREGPFSLEYIEYNNSMHRKSRMIKSSVLAGDFGINLFTVTGYEYKLGILPFYNAKIDNVELEFTFIPAMDGYGNTNILTVMKRVVF